MPVSSDTSDSELEPARYNRPLLPQLTPDGRLVYEYSYSAGRLGYILASRYGRSRGRVRDWLVEITQDTRPWTPGFLD